LRKVVCTGTNDVGQLDVPKMATRAFRAPVGSYSLGSQVRC
jgi:hypothetical protein